MTTILDWIKKTNFLRNPENIKILDICKDLKFSSPLTDVLIKMIERNDSKPFEYILEQNVSLNDLDSTYAITPLMYASQRGKVEFVEKLLLKGVDVDRIINKNVAALNYALIHRIDGDGKGNHIKCAKLLIKAGANIEFVSNNTNAYEMATLLKNEIEREMATNKELVTCVINNKSETCVTNDGMQVTIPQKIEIRIIIKILHEKTDPILCNTHRITNDAFVEINNGGIWQKKLLNHNTNNYIEVPQNVDDKISYHFLPAGVTLDGIITTENFVCKFNSVWLDGRSTILRYS